jgi:hypothetical protein
MKKILMILVAAVALFQTAAFAAIVEGAVKSVDAEAKKIQIGDNWITYGDTTTWPAGITDPSSLVGKNVTVNTDDATSQATSVAEAAAQA